MHMLTAELLPCGEVSPHDGRWLFAQGHFGSGRDGRERSLRLVMLVLDGVGGSRTAPTGA